MNQYQGKFGTFALPSWFRGPEKLERAIRRAWKASYKDLYQPYGESKADNAFAELLGTLGDLSNHTVHKRYVLNGLAMALAVQETIFRYRPEDNRPAAVIAHVCSWFHDPGTDSQRIRVLFQPEIAHRGRFVAVDESYNVLYNLLLGLEADRAATAIQDVLYDAVTGDAISPLVEAKRDIFNWWLIEVLPASYHLRLPRLLYAGRTPALKLGDNG